jgi:tetratricopeptide (TPR) repeat protein
MKKSRILLLVLTFACSYAAFCQSFEKELISTFNEFENDTSYVNKINFSNKLSLIANKWNDQWVACYCAAYSYTVLSFIETDVEKRDGYLDEADKFYAKVLELLPDKNDEVYVLGAFMANARLSVKPSSRWKKYGEIFNENLEHAKQINPDNPKIYCVKGVQTYHLPKALGGGAKNALPYLEKSIELYKDASDEDINKPLWGKNLNLRMLYVCKSELNGKNKG